MSSDDLQMPEQREPIVNIIDKVDKTVKEQLKQFIQQSGKYLAIALFFVLASFVTGSAIPEYLFITTFVFIPLIIMCVVIYLIWWIASDQIAELRSDMIGIATSHRDTTEDLVTQISDIDHNLRGRIKNLEDYSPYAIYEQDLSTGRIIHTNPQFVKIFGFNQEQINDQVVDESNIQEGSWILKFCATIVHPDYHNIFKQFVETRDFGKAVKVWLRNNEELFFPAVVKFHLLDENGNHYLQGFISDETNVSDMIETIRAQNDLIKSLTDVYVGKHTDRTQAASIIDRIKQTQGEISEQLRRSSRPRE